MVLECLSLAGAAQDTVSEHPAPAPLYTRRRERRSGKQEPGVERGGIGEGTVLSEPRSLHLCCTLAATDTMPGTARM